MKFIKRISLFLGVSLFLFGALKFVNPFKGWYAIQIANSGMGKLSYTMGVLGELSVGGTFVLMLIFQSKISHNLLLHTVIVGSTVVIIMMLTGIYVHLHPNVPADVLPLKIKAPFIPGFFLLLALANNYLAISQYRSNNSFSPR
jgi:hypothetical protein